jgi:glucosamine--fructose-6-phosphate aminotransferase (isomerizing)
MTRVRRLGKVQMLAQAVEEHPLHGGTGIAHTRWATHGEPSEGNAHPHVSEHIVVVHNGIIENHEPLREAAARGYVFVSETDTEVIAHLVHWELEQGGTLRDAVLRAIPQLRGAYGTVIMDSRDRELCWRRVPVARWLSVWAWVKTLSLPISWRCCRLPVALSSSKRAISRK